VYLQYTPVAIPIRKYDVEEEGQWRGVVAEISSMDESVFRENVEATIDRLLERPKNWSEEMNRFWGRIVTSRYDFEAPEVLCGVQRVLIVPSLPCRLCFCCIGLRETCSLFCI
jgi:hypothetical protein